MVAPFRDVGDPAADSRFAQHIGIAEDALEDVEKVATFVRQFLEGGLAEGITQETLDAWGRRFRQGWESTWDQLKEARKIAVAKGRDVAEFDLALALAGDLYLGVAEGTAVEVGNRVHLKWKNVSTQPARDAIAALRAAMPEVVVVKQAPVEVDLAPSSNKAIVIAIVVGIVALLGYFIYRVAR
jgi:hypothetical protein